MKRMKTKQILVYLVGMLVCRISFAGCYPVIPAYYAAACLSGCGRIGLTLFSYIGILFFLPMADTAKYSMILLFTLVVIYLVEWQNKSCRTKTAAAAAGIATGVLSVFGGVLNWNNDMPPFSGILEGGFVFGLTMLLGRFFYFFFQEKKRESTKEKEQLQKEERLQTYAKSFSHLSRVFSVANTGVKNFELEEYDRMKEEVAGKICVSCSQCAICWENENSRMQEYFFSLISSLKKWGEPREEEQKKLATYCPYTSSVVEETVRVFEKTQLNMAWYSRLLENREVIAQQLDAMAYIMEDCALPLTELTKSQSRMLAEIKYQAKERGIHVAESGLYEKKDGHRQFVFQVSARKEGCVPVKEMLRAVNVASGEKVRAHRDEKTLIGKEPMRLVLEEDTVYHTIHGVARLVKEKESISGDNFSFLELDDGEIVMSLSDGMGSGNRACKESEMVIELIEKFLEAGFSKETAIHIMNSAMVIRGEDDLFSTIDLGALNLYNGSCTFYKIGAAATFIKHKDSVECIISETLPVGVSHKVEIEKTTRQMENGDFIIMMTDGVLEYLHVPKPEVTMQEIIESIQTNHPRQLAKKILERVMLFTGGSVADDMTVMAAAIWEKA